MVNLYYIDIGFLVLFTLIVVTFLYVKRKNLQKEGLLYLYRTKIGLKLIDWFGKKHAKWLRPLQYVVIGCGYVLMIGMIYALLRLAYVYISSPFIAKALKVPVVFPLIPYLPEIFKIDFLPPFYFTYWIIIIAIIAIPHEFAHGIFARLNNVRIKSTGFGFLGPFLAAFVEQDDKQMLKSSKFAQLSILAAGTFANVLMTILFGIIMYLFFIGTFVPAGVNFSGYANNIVNVSDISKVDNISISNFSINQINQNETYMELILKDNEIYFVPTMILNQTLSTKLPYLIAYDNSPAFNAKIKGAISSFDGVQTRNYDQLKKAIISHKPGDEVKVITIDQDTNENYQYDLKLGNKNGSAYLGVGLAPISKSGVLGWFYGILSSIKDPYIYYQSRIGDMGIFIFQLLWWIVVVSISVALTNMLPMGIFDGGRFFMLTIWGITGSKKAGERAFKWSTWIILLIVAALMVKWIFTLF